MGADRELVVVVKFAADAAWVCRAKSSVCKVRSPNWLGDVARRRDINQSVNVARSNPTSPVVSRVYRRTLQSMQGKHARNLIPAQVERNIHIALANGHKILMVENDSGRAAKRLEILSDARVALLIRTASLLDTCVSPGTHVADYRHIRSGATVRAVTVRACLAISVIVGLSSAAACHRVFGSRAI